jgi:predicted PurR-regulated permease PerM
MAERAPAADLIRTVLAVLFLGLLIGSSLWVLSPFLPALVWSVMLVVATWPLMRGVERRLGGRRGLAVGIMTGAVLLVLVVPLTWAIATIVRNTEALSGWSRSIAGLTVPPPPDWLERIPLLGSRARDAWAVLAATTPEEWSARVVPHVGTGLRWFARQVGSLGLLFVHFLMTVILSAILYARGESAAGGLMAFAQRLAGARGERAVELAGQAIRGVALGVVGTALIQSALVGVGLAVARIPYAGILTAIAFLLCIAQLGPLLVLIPAVGWLYWTGATVGGTALLVWTVITGASDNVLRPLLIRRGADLPMLLILAGVLGGLIAFGVIGLFVGPIVLAVTYTLLVSWVRDGAAAATAPALGDPPPEDHP